MSKGYQGPLWQHRVGEISAEVVAFCAGRDIAPRPPADEVLIPFDLWTNQAHAVMLARQGILAEDELRSLLDGLAQLRERNAKGAFRLKPELEDVHGNIESALAEICGPGVAGKIHTARSRNDQAACTMRLYLRQALLDAVAEMLILAQALCETAAQHTETVMPGFTHRQHGTISSLAHLLLSHAQAVTRDIERALAVFPLLNVNPLGAAASYGTGWPIDRDLTARLLAFDGVQTNALDAVGTRWEAEAQVVSILSFFMNHASVLAGDLIFMTTQEAGMIRLADDYVTGSSIMPQKRNPDVAEVILAKASLVHGSLLSLLALPKGNLSGYNREYQYSKYAAMDAIDESRGTGVILAGAIRTMDVNTERLAAGCRTGFLCAVDLADCLARTRGLPFRKTHNLVAAAVAEAGSEEAFTRDLFNQVIATDGIAPLTEAEWLDATDPLRTLRARTAAGGPAPQAARACRDELAHRLGEQQQALAERRGRIDAAQATLLDVARRGLQAL